jgi:BlaI family penicillinase repressor
MPPPRPTPAELEILDVLWARGASTVRDVHALLDGSKPTGYTTVLKLLQIMTDKGLVVRDETQRAHVYQPRASREATQTRLVAELADRAFGGSAMALAMRAIGSRKATRAELAEIRRLLDEAEGRAR